MTRVSEIEIGNPRYDINSATLQKLRWAAHNGLATLTPEQRREYGEAVERAVKSAQRSTLKRAGETERTCHCASRTNHNTGEAIHNAIRAQQRAEMMSWASKIRRARTPAEWESMYEQAMKEKRARQAASLKLAA